MTDHLEQILTFVVDNQRFAILLSTVERVIQAVAVTRLTHSPSFIEGAIDYHGEVIAVLNMRKRLGFPFQELKVTDQFIIAHSTIRKMALIVDQVENIVQPHSHDLYQSSKLDERLDLFTVLRDDDGIILIPDLERFLSQSEEIQLDKGLEATLATTNHL